MSEPFEETIDPGLVQIKVLGPGCPNCERLEQDLIAHGTADESRSGACARSG